MVWATVGVVVTPMGWLAAEKVCLNPQIKADNPQLASLAEMNRSPYRSVFQTSESVTGSIQILGREFTGPRRVFENIVKPFRALFRSGWSAREYLYLLFGSLWTMVVWSFIGCAITRVCLLRLTCDESLGVDDAFDYAVFKFRDCMGAIAMPFAGIAIICVPMTIVGMLMGFDLGVFLASIFWFVVLAASAVIVFLLLGLMFGWPLIVSSISAEGQNAFDAVTRAFAYVFQRPLNYALYALVAILFGGFCWMIVANVTNSVISLSYWSTSWGANRTSQDRIEVIKGDFVSTSSVYATGEQAAALVNVEGDPEGGEAVAESPLPELKLDAELQDSGVLNRGRKIIGFWNGIARTLAAAFIHGLFWCMAGAIYLLLRRDVDETEMDEIYLVDEQRTYDLPPLQSDEHGIPQVKEPVAVDETAKTDSPDKMTDDT